MKERGQATVEFVLIIPAVALVVLLVVQVAVVMRESILLAHTTREIVRVASLSPQPDVAVNRSLADYPLKNLDVKVRHDEQNVYVDVNYTSHTTLPFIGELVPDIRLSQQSTMYWEGHSSASTK